jgi:hypothetical protein
MVGPWIGANGPAPPSESSGRLRPLRRRSWRLEELDRVLRSGSMGQGGS